MSAIRYCPVCEGIITEGAERCTICGNDLHVNQPMFEPPSFYRSQAQLAAQQEAAEPSAVLGVMAWIAQILGSIWLFLFCILPVILLVLIVLIILYSMGHS